MVALHKVGPADYPAAAALHNRVNPWAPPVTVEMITHFVRTADPAQPTNQVLAVDGHQPIGLGVLAGSRNYPARYLIVAVEQAYRRRGVGTRLLDWLARRLASPQLAHAEVFEDCSAGISFALRQGFAERSRKFPSVLDLTRFEPSRFVAYRQAAEAGGLRFATFAAVDSVAMRHGVHQLQDASQADVPTPKTIQPVSFQEWEAAWLEAPWFRPELLAVVLDGDRPVALSYVTERGDGAGYNPFTGVAADYRGRGLATAVKVEALRLAKRPAFARFRPTTTRTTGQCWRSTSDLATSGHPA